MASVSAQGFQGRHKYRPVVMAALEESPRVVSAQEIYVIIRARNAPIGLSTVYRELHSLAQDGRIRETHVGGETVYCLSDRDLMVCDDCGRTAELSRSPGPSDALSDFFGTRAAVTVHGRCALCAGAAPEMRPGLAPAGLSRR